MDGKVDDLKAWVEAEFPSVIHLTPAQTVRFIALMNRPTIDADGRTYSDRMREKAEAARRGR